MAKGDKETGEGSIGGFSVDFDAPDYVQQVHNALFASMVAARKELNEIPWGDSSHEKPEKED